MTKLNVNFINPFVEGTLNTLSIQCSFKAEAGKPFVKGKGAMESIDIAAVVGLVSSAFRGSISISFPRVVFLDAMAGMLGERYEFITRELEDGAGEILNMIFGWAKRELEVKGYQIQKAIPSIIRGQSTSVGRATSADTLVIPFQSASGRFYMEITIDSG
jgi:chemotaxis protein CheX